jgi:hypothetical protein
MSSAGYEYIDSTGVIIPDTADLQTEVAGEFATALQDPNLPTDPETPQGALIVAETLARSAVVANNAAVANQFNPNEAGGIFLEALCRLTGLEPPIATPTVILGVTITGVSNTTVPAGSLCAPSTDPTAPQFQTTSAVTIMGGTATVDIQAVLPGPTPATPVGAWVIVSQVLGWETIDITSGEPTIGTNKLSDAALRTLRNQTLGLNGVGLVESTISALNDTPGVQSLQFLENVQATTQTISGISLVANSIWACVSGGADADVAAALLGAKGLGCNWNGATTVNVTDPVSGQTYPVKFDRPVQVPIWVRVTYKAASVSGQDMTTAIVNAVMDYATGNSVVGPGLGVGVDVSPFEISAAVAAEIPGMFITKVEQSIDGTTYLTSDLTVALDHIVIAAATRVSAVAV